MKTLHVWKIVIVGIVASLLASEVRADDKQEQKQKAVLKARAALALAAAAQPKKPAVAPAPKEVPISVPKKKDCACGDKCGCKDCTPDKCPVVIPAPMPPRALTYEQVYLRVVKGERVQWTGAPPGLPAGCYECFLQDGKPMLKPVGGELCVGGS